VICEEELRNERECSQRACTHTHNTHTHTYTHTHTHTQSTDLWETRLPPGITAEPKRFCLALGQTTWAVQAEMRPALRASSPIAVAWAAWCLSSPCRCALSESKRGPGGWGSMRVVWWCR
jgi:hypothetical protein